MLEAAPYPYWGNVIQEWAKQFISLMTTLLTTINTTVIEISRLASISVLLIGLLLYFSHVERRLGKDLIKGGVLLAILSEIVLPQINRA
jgi:hypothetical protein